MRPASAALQNYLAANDTFVVVDLYTFALPSGAVLRYSNLLDIASVASECGTLKDVPQLFFTARLM